MPLTAGTRLGPYEILSPLGAGGMGEVYLARDQRLGRDVALKVVPEHLSANPEIRTRFEREAKAISSLNHPNICTLYDVGHVNGTDYLVMERIEGETLAQRLQRGPLPIADVLRIGSQIADALDRAHRAGVVHRDLKPGNVMLTRSGAKLMDFGLARATGLTATSGSGTLADHLTQSPTVAAPLTAEGTIVGTFQYLSPEQLEGRESDERSDIWALGCVLHEMATGQPAFQGRSQATLISAIMSSEPPAVSALAPLSPPGLDRIVRACLTKDPDERARSAHDIKLQLRGLLEPGSTGATPLPAIEKRVARPSSAWLVAGAALVVALVLAIALAYRGGAPRGPLHLTLDAGARQDISEYAAETVISPDGSCVAYCAVDSGGLESIWIRRFDSPSPTMLLSLGSWGGVVRAAQLFWSPDSRSLGIIGNVGQVLTVSLAGGTSTAVCPAKGGRGASWSKKGVIVFAPTTQSGLMRVSAGGGAPEPVTTLDSTRHESGHRFPCFLPDGEHFLFTVMPPGPGGYDIFVGSLTSRTVRKVLTAQSSVTYASPGYLLYRRNDQVVAQRFDTGRLATIGEPIQLVAAPRYTDLDAEPVASASNDGRLVILTNPRPDAQLAWIDRSGVMRGTLGLPQGPWEAPVISPDDRYALVVNGDDLWRVDLARAVPLRLTTEEGYHNNAVWSPDGRMIAFSTGGHGREEIEVMSSDGSGTPQILPTTDDLFKNPSDWCREGLIVEALRGTTLLDMLLKPYPSGTMHPLVETAFAEWAGTVSPDGHWLAYISREANTSDIYVQSFPEPGHKVRVTSGNAVGFSWMAGSNGITYRTGDRTRLMQVKLTRQGDDLEVGEPEPFLTLPPDVVNTDLTHDGQRVLATIVQGSSGLRRMRVVFDWTAMLKR